MTADASVYSVDSDSTLLPPLPDGPAQPAGLSQPMPAAPRLRPGQMPAPDNGIPRFELVSVKFADGSYHNVEYVDIMLPGNNKSMPRHKVTEALRDKYRPWYEQWRSGLEMSPVGTPLEMWPIMTPAQVHQLKSLNIFTVEQLEQVADAHLHNIPMGRTLQNQARAWLKTKGEADAIETHRQREQAMTDAMRQMEDKIAAMSEALAKATAQPKPTTIPPEPVSQAMLADAADAPASQPTKRGPGRPPRKED